MQQRASERALPLATRARRFTRSLRFVAMSSTGFLGHVAALLGDTARAREILDDLLALAKENKAPPRTVTFVYLGLGETDLAMEWLERAYAARDSGLFFQPSMPICTSLWNNPRFIDLLHRVGLPSARRRH